MVKAELGTKRTCPECEARFYDLGKMPCECPKCEHAFEPEILLKSKRRIEEDKPKEPAAEAASDKEDDDEEEPSGVEEVTAEGMAKMPAEVDEDGVAITKDGDEGNDGIEIEGVSLDGDDDESENEDDATLVEFDDDAEDVAAIIDSDIVKNQDGT